MAVQWTEEKAVAFIKRFLTKDIDLDNKKLVKSHRQDLLNVANNVRRAMAQGKLDALSARLDRYLKECDKEAMRLQFGLRIGSEPLEGFCLSEEVDEEVGVLVAEACSLLDQKLPGTYTRRMFQRWGYMMGMIRQVDTVPKIGTRGFEALAEINALHCSAEYIVWEKAQQYGEQVTKHLRRGCLERMEEVLKEHNAI